MKPFPLVEYAQSIQKNTAELTTSDMVAFMKWWLKQKPRKDLINVTPKQQITYNKDVTAMNKYRAAQHSRLPIEILEQGIESPINDGEEEIVIHTDEIVCSMDLTQMDVSSLIWGLETLLNEYDLEENEIGVSLKGLLDGKLWKVGL